jgi:anthranilate phosphoribosyltransferase
MNFTPKQALERVIEHREIFPDEMTALMRQIMTGEVSPTLIAGILIGLRVKKETVGEIAAAARVMRELSVRVPVRDTQTLVDTCGTGGDGAHTFNISTASMFVAAARGPAWPSTADARVRRSAVRPTCWRRWASM